MTENLIYRECLPEVKIFRYFSVGFVGNLLGDLPLTIVNACLDSWWRRIFFALYSCHLGEKASCASG
jgi:hypothetical protein